MTVEKRWQLRLGEHSKGSFAASLETVRQALAGLQGRDSANSSGLNVTTAELYVGDRSAGDEEFTMVLLPSRLLATETQLHLLMAALSSNEERASEEG